MSKINKMNDGRSSYEVISEMTNGTTGVTDQTIEQNIPRFLITDPLGLLNQLGHNVNFESRAAERDEQSQQSEILEEDLVFSYPDVPNPQF